MTNQKQYANYGNGAGNDAGFVNGKNNLEEEKKKNGL
jgi:hypothetical protein